MWRLLELSSLQVLKITRMDMLRLVAVYFVAESAVLVAWTLVDPPLPKAIITDVSAQVTTFGCQQQNDAWWFVAMALKLAFLGFGTFLSIKNRTHAPIFNDSKSVGISTYVLFITMLIVGIIGIALRNYVAAVVIVKSLGIVIPYAVITLVLFGGTIVKILTGKPAATSLTYVKSSKSSVHSNTISQSSISEASESRRPEGRGGSKAPAPTPKSKEERRASAPRTREPKKHKKPEAAQEVTIVEPEEPKRRSSSSGESTPKKSKRQRNSGPRQATSAKSAATRSASGKLHAIDSSSSSSSD
jgi:hypothetical protein